MLPRGYTEEMRNELEVEAIEELGLQQRYENDWSFRTAVDNLHWSRMGTLGGCLDCMRVKALSVEFK